MRVHRWKFKACDPARAEELAESIHLSPLLARCLANRGCDSAAAAQQFIQPRLAHLGDPFALPGMSAAIDRLILAYQKREPFVIFGDYDVDGVTSTAILQLFFSALGWPPKTYLPHRLEEGYGLNQEAVNNCLQRHPCSLVVAVDCGSNSGTVIEELRRRGVDVIVLDHHLIDGSPAPAAALVNPQLLEGAHPLKCLCSAGLAFKLAHAFLKRGRELNWPEAFSFDLKTLLDLVALGTVADLAPLCGENRIFTRMGLDRLERSERAGLKALKKVAGIHGCVQAREVAFQLAPRLNAAGRLEAALDALNLLLTNDPVEAENLARTLEEQNRSRQALEQKIADEVITALRARFDPARDFAIVEGADNWHLGVVGIVASRVLREFYRPVLILGGDAGGQWRGSARSIEGFNFAAALRDCSDVLVKYGGHAMAAGVTVVRENISILRERLNGLARTQLAADQFQPCLELDATANLGDFTFEELRALSKLAPFGQGNPPVQFAVLGLKISGEPRRFGKEGQHLRFTVSDNTCARQAVWWNAPELVDLSGSFDLAISPELNEYNGSFGIQLRVLDLKPAASAGPGNGGGN